MKGSLDGDDGNRTIDRSPRSRHDRAPSTFFAMALAIQSHHDPSDSIASSFGYSLCSRHAWSEMRITGGKDNPALRGSQDFAISRANGIWCRAGGEDGIAHGSTGHATECPNRVIVSGPSLLDRCITRSQR